MLDWMWPKAEDSLLWPHPLPEGATPIQLARATSLRGRFGASLWNSRFSNSSTRNGITLFRSVTMFCDTDNISQKIPCKTECGRKPKTPCCGRTPRPAGATPIHLARATSLRSRFGASLWNSRPSSTKDGTTSFRFVTMFCGTDNISQKIPC